MTSKESSSGFSVVWVIVVLLVLAAIGFTGWSVANRKDTTTSPTPTAQTPAPVPSPTPSQPADPSEAGKYLVIKEWGVRVLLPSSLKGNVFYALREFDESDGHFEAADLNSKLFQPECRDTAADPGLDVIRTPTPHDGAAGFTHLGDFWYGSIWGKDGCSKFLTGPKADAFNELRHSIMTVEATN